MVFTAGLLEVQIGKPCDSCEASRLSSPAAGRPDPATELEAPGSLTHHRFRHLLERFSKGS